MSERDELPALTVAGDPSHPKRAMVYVGPPAFTETVALPAGTKLHTDAAVAQRDEQIARLRDKAVASVAADRDYWREQSIALRAEVEALRAARVPLTDDRVREGVETLRPSLAGRSAAIFWFTNGARFAERAHGIDAARAETKPADTHVSEQHVKALKQQMRADPQYALRFLVEAGIANPDGTLTEHYRAETKPAGSSCDTYETSSGDHTICKTCGECWPTSVGTACEREVMRQERIKALAARAEPKKDNQP